MSDVETRSGGPRIGLFGGTFDPPHRGHLEAALGAHRTLGLDRTLLVVAARPWQKVESRRVTPAVVRLEMVRAAVADLTELEASDIELRRSGDTCTIDTVLAVRASMPTAELYLIVGADAAAGFSTWVRHEELATLVRLVAVSRAGRRFEAPTGSEWLTVEVPDVDISSTELRRLVAAGGDISAWVAPEVAEIISRNDLYRSPDRSTPAGAR